MSYTGQGGSAGPGLDEYVWDGLRQRWAAASSFGGAVLSFSNRRESGAATRFLEPFSGSRVLAPVVAVQILAPRAGRLRKLFVRHRVAGGNAVVITYTVRVAGVATALAASIASNSGALQTSNIVDVVPVAQGDLVDIRVTKPSSIGPGPTDIFATVEFAL